MISLFHAFPPKGHLTVVASQRSTKSPAALYGMLREAFARRRPTECSCKMPILFRTEPNSPQEPNWRVEALWCGSLDCQYALTEVVSHHACLYDLDEEKSRTAEREIAGNF